MILRGLAMRFSEFSPKKFREQRLRKALNYAAFEGDADEWLGKRLLAAFLLGLAAFLLVFNAYRLLGFLYFPEYEFPLSLPLGGEPLVLIIPVIPLLASSYWFPRTSTRA